MTALAMEIRAKFGIPLGINMLRNDGQSALAVAVACDAAFIRVNVCVGRVSRIKACFKRSLMISCAIVHS